MAVLLADLLARNPRPAAARSRPMGTTFSKDYQGYALRKVRGEGYLLFYTNAWGGRVPAGHAMTRDGVQRLLQNRSPEFRGLMAPWYVTPCRGDGWYASVTFRSGEFEAADIYREGGRPGQIPPEAFELVWGAGGSAVRGSRAVAWAPGPTPGTLVGWRVMRYDPGTNELVSMANSRIRLPSRPGAVHRMPTPGMFLTPFRQYALQHYASNDVNALLSYAFRPEDVTRGALDDREPEVAVPVATLLSIELFDEDGLPWRS